MPNDFGYRPEPLFISRPDKTTEDIIETAVRMVMESGLSAAEAYLRDQGVSAWTAMRVLNSDGSLRRKPR